MMDGSTTRQDDYASSAALYVRSAESTRSEHAGLHLERLLWSYNRELAVQWAACWGWPRFTEEARSAGPRFAVAFVEEEALPPHERGAVRAAELLAHKLVLVSRAPDKALPPAEPAWSACLPRPLAYETFCAACAALLAPEARLPPFAGRFEYVTEDVLRDIWSEAGAAPHTAPPPVCVAYSLRALLTPGRAEALCATRHSPPYTLLFANAAFYAHVGWEPGAAHGRDLRFLQGAATERQELERLHAWLEGGRERTARPWSGRLINYTQAGRPFCNRLTVSECSDASLFVGCVDVADPPAAEELGGVEAAGCAPAARAQPRAQASRDGEQPAAGTTSTDEQLAAALGVVLLDASSSVVLTEAAPPFAILHVNESWCDLCGFRPEEVAGRTLRTIQGPATDAAAVAACMAELLRRNTPVRMRVVNYKKGGAPFANRLHVEPLCGADGRPRFFVGRLAEEADTAALPAALSV